MTRRKKEVPWLYQHSRLIIGSIAILGIMDTAYLTWVKLSNNGVCGAEACERVLTSPFANFNDLPLTGFGLMSYIAVTIMAFAPTLFDPKTNKAGHKQINDLTWFGLLLAGIGMSIFSGYLVYLLAFVIQAACPFCIASALFSFTIFGVALFGHEWEDLGQVIFAGMATALAAIFISLLFYNTAVGSEINSIQPIGAPQPGIGWEIKSTSGANEIKLAEHLTQQGAKMYGAYWCPHCYEQKQLFGKKAWEKVTYIECGEDAIKNPQPKACKDAGIKGFPTWLVNGKTEPGVKKLAKLGQMTGYKGGTAFKYDPLFKEPS
jgi:uncharacterized membrane protein